jgi:hypothetical protein
MAWHGMAYKQPPVRLSTTRVDVPQTYFVSCVLSTRQASTRLRGTLQTMPDGAHELEAGRPRTRCRFWEAPSCRKPPTPKILLLPLATAGFVLLEELESWGWTGALGEPIST